MEKFEYMKISLALFPKWKHKQYNLDNHAPNGSVYWGIRSAIYGLPNAGRLANLRRRDKLKPAGFYEVRPIQCSLILDNFGIKSVGKEDMEYLITSLQQDLLEDNSGLEGGIVR